MGEGVRVGEWVGARMCTPYCGGVVYRGKDVYCVLPTVGEGRGESAWGSG